MQRSRQAAVRRLTAKVCQKCGLTAPSLRRFRSRHHSPVSQSSGIRSARSAFGKRSLTEIHLPNDENRLPLESVITTPMLRRRASRAPDFAAENAALVFLMSEMGTSPTTILQTLADTALKVCRADSAGISLLEKEDGLPLFRWHAVAGGWSPFIGSTMPRDMSPCGVVIDRDSVLLLERPERHFPMPEELSRSIAEVLLIPFHWEGEPVGTIWVVSHEESRQFDGEDERIMSSLARFASVAHQTLSSLNREKARLEEERQSEATIQRSIAASEQRLRFVLDSMPQKVFTADTSGSVTYLNPQWTEFTGLTFEQIRDWGWTQFIHPDDVDENIRVWKRSIETGEPLLFDHRFRRADGEYFWHSSRVLPIRDVDGRITMWIGSNSLIDEVMKTKEALEEASRRKDEFLATLSHELRTPMTSILGWTALMMMTSLDDQTQRDGIASIHRSALVQAELIDDMLDVARVVTGKLHLVIEQADLETLVRAAIAVVAPAAKAKKLEIEVEFESPIPPVSGDATRLQQITWNLLSNAVKFTPMGGRISVRLFSEDAFVHLVVRDSGIGIRPDFLPYAFDRFAQQDVGASRRNSGLGIGLALVKQLVELHGGTVRASSEGEGQGSEFTVSLPVRDIQP